jgi:hypothetical protein
MACLAQVFMSPGKASRAPRPASERVPAEILRRVTWQRIPLSEPFVCSGISGCRSTAGRPSFWARSLASSRPGVAKPVSVEKMASKRRASRAARRLRQPAGLERLVEPPDAAADALLSLDMRLADRIELVDEALRMHPAERMLRDPEPARAIGDGHRAVQEALLRNRAPPAI